jgi:heterotetrameric sarcosine oxidase alpha subunit
MSAQPFRNPTGGMIDRSRPLRFTFDGRSLSGYAGDSLASALLANGVRIVGRSFKYHRPRGIFGAGTEEPNALVQLGSGRRTLPNSKATEVELYEGLTATSQNCWPSLSFDLGAAASLFAPLLPAGFYYKTFKWPAAFWEKVYEPLIRRAAGLGRAPTDPDPDRYEHREAHCDVLVVGTGPAGLSAAAAAAEEGARVILADEGASPGGSLLARRGEIPGETMAGWLARMVARLAAYPDLRLLGRTTAIGYYDHNQLALLEKVADHRAPKPGEPRQRLWHVRARRVVLATGAHERSLIFDNNDRPGVMLASAARAYVNRYAVRPGSTAVIVTNNDTAYEVAHDLAGAGVRVVAVVDCRDKVRAELAADLARSSVEHLVSRSVASAVGGRSVRAVDIGPNDPNGRTAARRRIACDLLCVSGGWSPALHLHAQTGAKPVFDAPIGAFLPGTPRQAERLVGGAAGNFDIEAAIAEGEAAGREAAREAKRGNAARSAVSVPKTLRGPEGAGPVWRSPPHLHGRGKRFIDLQEDVTDKDVALAVREGYRSVEHVKRYTTLGMGTDQGKIGNTQGFVEIARAQGRDIADGGTTTFRPPYVPVTLGALAGMHGGQHFLPVRRTPMHDWHVGAKAEMAHSGSWLRAQAYPRRGESLEDAARREARAVRQAVGIVDVSTLGKLELFGSDAAEFVERVYANGFASLPVGRCRYGLMLREDGMVFDDGTVSRLGEQHYFITTTTAQAALVRRRLEHCRQVLWPRLDVEFVAVTDQWAAIALAGPASRQVLAKAVDIDVGDKALPYMALALGCIAGVDVRLFRISFSGDLAYEIYVPARRGAEVWQRLLEVGAEHGITPYGLDALNALRIEKGHVTGAELNGRTTAEDLGLGRMLKAKGDFIGKRSLGRPGLTREGRWQLVGLTPVDGRTPIPSGAKLVADAGKAAPVPILGEVTSTAFSPSLDRPIALALLADGRSRRGDAVIVSSPLFDLEVPAVATSPVFFDPEGKRLRG